MNQAHSGETGRSRIVIKVNEGNFRDGFAVSVRIESRKTFETMGRFPFDSSIEKYITDWREIFRENVESPRFEKIGEPRKFSSAKSAERLEKVFNKWLENRDNKKWTEITNDIRKYLDVKDEIQIIISTDDENLQRLPWAVWKLFDEDFKKSEISLWLPKVESASVTHRKTEIRILAVFGKDDGIDTGIDKDALSTLQNHKRVKIHKEEKPAKHTITGLLRNHRWEILFFAGHGESDENGKIGWIYFNDDEKMSIDEFKYSLEDAIDNGLRLAIFNCCDGLGLANQLAKLNLPGIIVMRERIPDEAAHSFLRHFCDSYSSGLSVNMSVRKAREMIGEELPQYPGIAWVPMMFQNSLVEILPTITEIRRNYTMTVAIVVFCIALATMGCIHLYRYVAGQFKVPTAGMEFVHVKGGDYKMQNSETVRVEDFWIGKTEVTQAQWKMVMDGNPSYHKDCDDCPVENVRWKDALGFIQKLNKETGENYRLPTELEWEFVCMSGFGNSDIDRWDVSRMAWHKDNAENSQPVGLLEPNGLGVRDMLGNVREWCYVYDRPDIPTDYRAVRGGSWLHSDDMCGCAKGSYFSADTMGDDIGFRLVKPLD